MNRGCQPTGEFVTISFTPTTPLPVTAATCAMPATVTMTISKFDLAVMSLALFKLTLGMQIQQLSTGFNRVEVIQLSKMVWDPVHEVFVTHLTCSFVCQAFVWWTVPNGRPGLGWDADCARHRNLNDRLVRTSRDRHRRRRRT